MVYIKLLIIPHLMRPVNEEMFGSSTLKTQIHYKSRALEQAGEMNVHTSASICAAAFYCMFIQPSSLGKEKQH